MSQSWASLGKRKREEAAYVRGSGLENEMISIQTNIPWMFEGKSKRFARRSALDSKTNSDEQDANKVGIVSGGEIDLHITLLPAEIHLQIFDNLDPVSAACLGVTCRKFYPLFGQRGLFLSMSLCTFTSNSRCSSYSHKEDCELSDLLKGWVLDDLVYGVFRFEDKIGKVWTKETHERLTNEETRLRKLMG